MQNEQEFYRCLVSDAAGRTLKKILEIIRDDTLSDEICFHKIEAIISPSRKPDLLWRLTMYMPL